MLNISLWDFTKINKFYFSFKKISKEIENYFNLTALLVAVVLVLAGFNYWVTDSATQDQFSF